MRQFYIRLENEAKSARDGEDAGSLTAMLADLVAGVPTMPRTIATDSFEVVVGDVSVNGADRTLQLSASVREQGGD